MHKRIALGIIKITGTNGNRIILGFIISTGFLSLWLSNTATTMMMFPIATSVIHVISSHNKDGKALQKFFTGADAVAGLCIQFCRGYHHWHTAQYRIRGLYPRQVQLHHRFHQLDDRLHAAYHCAAVDAVLGAGKMAVSKQYQTQY